ncbi:uncharacterized protein N7496_001578 [Penicillium cataractarum]|uniref:Uncharacterized protein n=1 Tax=Penicillium cataractarum TaxID=2100454 RepID=A0A9W9VWG9_9EURO|nr:uncharacterized protein N7496_001578 [Penicillium cataractarum]KAJ5390510.1 hypothetical protein N7496_001578 [Penicillium cataractarum]
MDGGEPCTASEQNAGEGSRRTRAPLTCTLCCRRFARKEHLVRHLRIHTQEKPFTCGTCGKMFSRMDILSRHTEIHAQERQPNTTKHLSKRACVQCATSRIRCTRENPCGRCDSKGLRCEYGMSPTRKLRDKEGVSEVDPNPSPDDVAVNDAIAGPMSQTAALDDGHSTQDPLSSGVPLNRNDHGEISISADIPPGPIVYEPGSRQTLGPEFISGINWLSPGQAIFQEWGSQLAEITDNEFFPPMFNMMDLTEMPQLVSAGTEQEIASGNPSQPFSGCAQLGSWDDTEGHPGIGEPKSPETFRDGLSTGTSGSIESKYYVHGVTSRAPFQRRSCNSGAVPEGSTSDLSTSASIASNIPSSVDHWLTREVYARVVFSIQEQIKTQPQIPPLEYFRLCVHLYFDRLHPNFPFINRATFLTTDPHWILLTAVAGVGAAYVQSPLGTQWKNSLMEIMGTTLSNHLSRYQNIPQEADSMQPLDIHITMELVDEVMPLIQAKILHMLFMLHNSTLYITRRAGFERAELTQWCSYLNLLSTSNAPTSIKGATDVQLWVKAQSRLRAGMMIWLLDSMLSYELNCKHVMKLGDTAKWLPCLEVAWEQPSIANIEFAEKYSISFVDAIDMLYIEKRVSPHISEFSHVLLIHAIYRRTTEVLDESCMRLLSWSPTSSMQVLGSEPNSVQEWPPSSTTASNWRNAACDSLDVLNWAANSKAAELCWEEPTILYLHLSRLMLLAPIAHFQTLARFPSSHTLKWPAIPPNQYDYENARNQVLQWAIRDQFKARLSVVHAGALLWHVRRFSTDNAIEPFSIYIAALLLWAYSASTYAVSNSGGPMRADETLRGDGVDLDDSDDEPLWIRLDRPLDDELVQTYIRVGNKMSAHLKGVGDIGKHDAPLKILKQGYHLLTGNKYDRSLDSRFNESVLGETKHCTWEIRRSYASTIQFLIDATGVS